MRGPMFMLMFLGVMGVQLYYRKQTASKEIESAMEDMGPLAKAVAGKQPGGKRLSEK